MTLPFLERMKARQRAKEARGERVRDPKYEEHYAIQLRRGGILADEKGEPVVFIRDARTGLFDNPKEKDHVERMVDAISSGRFGPCHLPNHTAYYNRKTILQPR